MYLSDVRGESNKRAERINIANQSRRFVYTYIDRYSKKLLRSLR